MPQLYPMATQILGFEGGEHGFLSPHCALPQVDFWTRKNYERPTTSLHVTKCIAPNEFWLQNKSEEDKLRAFEKEMTQWYDKYWEEGNDLSKKQVISGGIYAAYWEHYQVWLRVRVLNVLSGKDGNEVKYAVQSLDYGNVSSVPLDHILPLRQQFNIFPVQAVKAEVYDESMHKCFDSSEETNFLKFVTGRDVHVLTMDQRKDTNGCPIISVIFATKPFENDANFDIVASSLFDLGGRLVFKNFVRMMKDIHREK